jgi:hypothetical protein
MGNVAFLSSTVNPTSDLSPEDCVTECDEEAWIEGEVEDTDRQEGNELICRQIR